MPITLNIIGRDPRTGRPVYASVDRDAASQQETSNACYDQDHANCGLSAPNGTPCTCSCHEDEKPAPVAKRTRKSKAAPTIAAIADFGATPSAPAPVEAAPVVPAKLDKKESARLRKAKSRAANREHEREVNRAALARYRATHPNRNKKHAITQPTPASEQAAQEIVETIHAAVTGFSPSRYQQAIFDWVAYGTGNAIVGAVAGSGKTTTLVQAASLLTEPAFFFAFNKHVAEELQARLAGTTMTASTLHSYGMKVTAAGLGKPISLKSDKYRNMIKDAVGALIPGFGEAVNNRRMAARELLCKLCDLCRLSLVEPRDGAGLERLMEHHSLYADPEIEEICLSYLPSLIAQGIQTAKDTGVIDFTDMLYLPIKLHMTYPKAAWVFVDEAQDLNAAQLETAINACEGRMLCVGDSAQAIYGFAGADSSSFDTIRRRLGAVELPLSICYRCPASHIALAKAILPAIEAAPNAKAGTLEYLATNDKAIPMLTKGDMVLCRRTAPLVSLCVRLIMQKIPAVVKGRDIGKMLTDIVQAVVAMPGYSWSEFSKYLNYYEQGVTDRLSQRRNPESAIESLSDRVEAVRACYESWGTSTSGELITAIESLFSDNDGYITLSTVHKAKGLEADRVFIVDYNSMPLQWQNQQDWEAEQEQNIKYVALTRSMSELYLVSC